MLQTLRRTKLFSVILACVAAACLIVGARVSSAQGVRRGLSPQAQRGKQIYLKGESREGGEIKVGLGSDNIEVPAAAFACANCHGLKGEGASEGGLQPPPITWATLTAPHTSALTRRERAPYTEETLARAIRTGLDPAGARLHPGMPQYEMTAGQMADLIAYLKQIGQADDLEAGLDENRIKLGAALPLTGPLAPVGEDIKATIDAYFAEVNAQGGVYGRQLELVAADSQGDPVHTLQATKRLVEQDNVFALVGSFEPRGSAQVNEYLRQSETVLVGPVTLSPRLTSPPNPSIFYLLPTFSDQARVLVDFAAAKSANRPARVALIYAGSEFDADALAGLHLQTKLYPMEIVFEYGYESGRFSAERVGAPLAQSRPDYIFFFGGAEQFTTLARAVDATKLRAPLFSSVVMVGRAAFDVPAAVAAQTFLAYPAALPATRSDLADFLAVMQSRGVKLRSPAFQAVAFGAAKTLVEAAKISGREITRPALLSALEQLRDYQTGVVPPLTFGPNRRIGADSCLIVGIDLSNKQYVPMGARLTPKEKL
jgi:ABC-type branched-subunit amino acid transport system substrate-binding protein